MAKTFKNIKENFWEDDPEKNKRTFKRKYKGVEVGIAEIDGMYVWEYTNYGSTEERAAAIDHFHKKYDFQNWD